ncbi:small multidrug efflux protein [Promicromonospora sp. NPDC050880]|uniref:small multidrug efflux protein n=1 Tax=Promicromonospora sp. NPDC050880 TaxID=3364406 RepID=UPI00379EF21B
MAGFNPYEDLQDLVAQVPELVQPLIVAFAGAIPYIEGEGSAALGVLAGINPVVAGVSGAAGNIIAVVLVVLLSSRARGAVQARRARKVAADAGAPVAARAVPAGAGTTVAAGPGTGAGPRPEAEPDATAGPGAEPQPDGDGDGEPTTRKAKGQKRLRCWLVRFGVPGASLLGPLALPTHLTAATLVASGVSKNWVILWQVIAIVAWTTVLTLAAAGFITAITAA